MAELVYPLPVFHFNVDFGADEVAFAEVSGLTIENQVIEYRDGSSKQYSSIKMPGIPKYSNITLKRGILPKDTTLFKKLNEIKMNKADAEDKRMDLTIKLLDENGDPVMQWTAKRAFPVKIEGPGLKSTGNEVAIETIEFAHEGLTISGGAE